MSIIVEKPSGVCRGCQVPFEHLQEHLSLLRIDGTDFLRHDYCTTCWQECTPGTDPQTYSFWRTRYTDPAVARNAPPPPMFIQLLELCYQLIQEIQADARQEEELCYLVAMILRRQKVFRLVRREHDEEGKIVLIFYDKVNDVQLRIRDPVMDYDGLVSAKARLEATLVQREAMEEHERATV